MTGRVHDAGRPHSDAAVRVDRVRAARRQIAETAKHRAEGADAG